MVLNVVASSRGRLGGTRLGSHTSCPEVFKSIFLASTLVAYQVDRTEDPGAPGLQINVPKEITHGPMASTRFR